MFDLDRDQLAGNIEESFLARTERTQKWSGTRLLLVLSDVAAIVTSSLLLILVVAPVVNRDFGGINDLIALGLSIPAWIAVAALFGLYYDFEWRFDPSVVNELGKIMVTAALWDWFLVFSQAAVSNEATEVLPLALLWFLIVPLALLFRAGSKKVLRFLGWNKKAICVLGSELESSPILGRVNRHPEWGIQVVAQIEDPDKWLEGFLRTAGVESAESVRPLGRRWTPLTRALKALGVTRLVIAGAFPDGYTLEDRTSLVQEVLFFGISVDIVTGGPESLYSRALNQDLEGLPLVSVSPSSHRSSALALKRVLDVVMAVIGLVVFSPLMIWTAIRVKLDSPGPIIFRSERAGRGGRVFHALKFRTMVENASELRGKLREELDANGGDILFKLEDDPRVTKVGSGLRRSSVDELPQLWNVLRGDMSMVGPRPLPPEEAAQAEDLFAARLAMRPGIAGPWQALGRSSIPFYDMVRLDYAYVMGWSLGEDLSLLLKTVSSALKREGSM